MADHINAKSSIDPTNKQAITGTDLQAPRNKHALDVKDHEATDALQEILAAISESIKGISSHFYDNANAVPVNTETLINSYTVPVGKGFDLNQVTCSGNNIARFIIKVNGSIIQAKRTWWANFNIDFNIVEKILSAGDKIEIFVENNGETAEFFESTIIGGVYDE